MKNIGFLFALLLPTLVSAAVMPEGVATKPTGTIVASCTPENGNLDFSELDLLDNQDLVATTNPKYLVGGEDEIAPYMLYRGLNVKIGKTQIVLKDEIYTLGGVVQIELTLKRNQNDQTVLLKDLGTNLVCDVL